MRKFVFGLVLMTTLFAVAKEPETTEQLKARAESAERDKQPKLYLELAERQVSDADHAYNTDVEGAKSIMEQAIQAAEKSGETSLQTGKDLKKIEIGLRKLSKRLDDLSRSWALEDRPPLKTGIQKIESARTKLLDRMFKK